MEVIALHDGALRRPLGEEFVTNAPLEQVKALLASQGLPTDYVDIPFTPFVIVAGAGGSSWTRALPTTARPAPASWWPTWPRPA
jgi:hypothetical protein